MALIDVNSRGRHPHIPQTATMPGEAVLSTALARIGKDAPITVLVGDMKFPALPSARCAPLDFPAQRLKPESWHRALGFSDLGHEDGLCLRFAWQARGRGLSRRALRKLYARTGSAGHALARLLSLVHQMAPGQPVDIVSHGMGTAVALRAAAQVSSPVIGRVILLNGTALIADARRALMNRAIAEAEFHHITGPGFGLRRWLFHTFVVGRSRTSLHRRSDLRSCRWANLSLDCPDTRNKLALAGLSIGADTCPAPVCLGTEGFALARALIRDRDGFSAPMLNGLLRADYAPGKSQRSALDLLPRRVRNT